MNVLCDRGRVCGKTETRGHRAACLPFQISAVVQGLLVVVEGLGLRVQLVRIGQLGC